MVRWCLVSLYFLTYSVYWNVCVDVELINNKTECERYLIFLGKQKEFSFEFSISALRLDFRPVWWIYTGISWRKRRFPSYSTTNIYPRNWVAPSDKCVWCCLHSIRLPRVRLMARDWYRDPPILTKCWYYITRGSDQLSTRYKPHTLLLSPESISGGVRWQMKEIGLLSSSSFSCCGFDFTLIWNGISLYCFDNRTQI